MADENKQDYSIFHGKPVSEWGSYSGADNYKDYLRRSKGNLKDQKEKQDYKKLIDWDNEKDSSKENNKPEYDENKIDWERLKTPYDVAFYLSVPKWFLSETDKEIKAFVDSKYNSEGKGMTMVGISKYANEKLKEINGGKDPKEKGKVGSNDQQENEQVETQEKPKSLWGKIVLFLKEKNQDYEKQTNSRRSDQEILETASIVQEKAEKKLEEENLDVGMEI